MIGGFRNISLSLSPTHSPPMKVEFLTPLPLGYEKVAVSSNGEELNPSWLEGSGASSLSLSPTHSGIFKHRGTQLFMVGGIVTSPKLSKHKELSSPLFEDTAVRRRERETTFLNPPTMKG